MFFDFKLKTQKLEKLCKTNSGCEVGKLSADAGNRTLNCELRTANSETIAEIEINK